ncbi:hypothetical protein L3476_14225 [Paenibacillus thiaminolyticus]|uniref:glycosyltransferase family 4 protein n=1 Tax=Paenibacillus thiaminolyticus TaxID=49283 RepID=UPI00234FFE0A|nr:hypothetical protein [Paenibacillus thiaminolyticus]WCR29777.1 hypothetical protein L3476_14225 [Paenibacillus thiaminolyticus]
MKPTMMLFSHMCNQDFTTGAEKHLLFLALELKTWYECIIIVPQEGRLSALAREAGIQSEIMPCPLMYSLIRPDADLPEEWERWKRTPEFEAIVDLLKYMQPDIVLTNTAIHQLPAAAAASLGIPALWVINETIAATPHTSLAAGLISSRMPMALSVHRRRRFNRSALRWGAPRSICCLHLGTRTRFSPAPGPASAAAREKNWG